MAYSFKEQETEFLFQSFTVFEKTFKEITDALPYTAENKTSWSPKLVNLFLDICSTFDSLCRHIIAEGKGDEEEVRIIEDGKNTTKKVKHLDITDFEENFLRPQNFLDKRVIVYIYYLFPNQCLIKPFENYLEICTGWWKIYNQLKHDRFNNFQKANLENTMRVLAALFVLLVSYKDQQFTLALLRWKLLETNLGAELVHPARIRTGGKNFWYDSLLFATGDCANGIEDIVQVNPSLASHRLRMFMGRLNPI